MRNGNIDASTTLNCQGVHRVGNRIFRCHARWGHGEVDLPAAIEGSCNVFYYSKGIEMGIDQISAEAKRFGLDQKTGIELPYETSRLVVPSKAWKREKVDAGWVPGDTANTAIGQGFLLQTPLQMATAIASIARSETRTKPTLKARQNKPVSCGKGWSVLSAPKALAGSLKLTVFVSAEKPAPLTFAPMARR
jgi:penicillin-binding protein 2